MRSRALQDGGLADAAESSPSALIEDVPTDLSGAAELARPARRYRDVMVVGRKGQGSTRHFRVCAVIVARHEQGTATKDLLPWLPFGDDVDLAVTSIGELTAIDEICVLVDDAADRMWIVRISGPVHDDPSDGHLPHGRLAAGFKVNGFGQTEALGRKK